MHIDFKEEIADAYKHLNSELRSKISVFIVKSRREVRKKWENAMDGLPFAIFVSDNFGYNMDVSKSIEQKLKFSGGVYQQMMQWLSIIDSFRGNWKAIEHRHSKHLKELRKIATIESIGSSTCIEGATLTDAEVEKLLKSVKITQLKTRDEQEVIGGQV